MSLWKGKIKCSGHFRNQLVSMKMSLQLKWIMAGMLSLPLLGHAQEVLDPDAALGPVGSLSRRVNEIAAPPDPRGKDIPAAFFELWETRSRAVADITRMGTNAWPAVPALVVLSGHPEIQVAVSAATVLASIRADESPEWGKVHGQLRASTNAYQSYLYLVTGKDEFLRPYDLAKRQFGLVALRACGPAAKPAAPGLIGLFQSKSEQDRKLWGVIGTILNEAGVDRALFVPGLRQTVENADESIDARVGAIEAIAASGSNDQDDRSLFRLQLRSEYSIIRVAAARALWKMGEKAEVLPTLIPLLKHKLPSVRAASLGALSEMGEGAQTAKSAVEPLLDDKSEAVRRAAAAALRQIHDASRLK